MADEKQDKIEDELSKIKEEMQELKEMLKEKRQNQPDEDWEDYDEPRGFNFRIDSDFEHDFDEMDFELDGIDSTLNNYLSSVMKGVSENIKRSMEKASHGIKQMEHDITRKAHRNAEKELRRTQKEIKRSMKEAKRRAKRRVKYGKDVSNLDRVIHLNKLSPEELEEFYEIGTKMVSALSDSRRLKLLKLLEQGPAYQGDLSEQTGVKGGTFKHHMDSLISAKYVYQEATRGRYLITQLGIEALKLAEMLYRRYKFEEREESLAKDVDVEFDESKLEESAEEPTYEISDIEEEESSHETEEPVNSENNQDGEYQL